MDLLGESPEREAILEAASESFGLAIERAIRDLPPKDLRLLDYRAAGRRWADIAQELGMTEAAARQQWVRTKRRVRAALRREYLIEELTNDD